MAIRIVYLTTLEIINSGEMLLNINGRWMLTSYPDAAIVGDALLTNGWIREDINQSENALIKRYALSKEGLLQLDYGRKWWNSLSFLKKIFIRFNF